MPHPTRYEVEKFLGYYESDLSDEDAGNLINEEFSDKYTEAEHEEGMMDKLFECTDHYRAHGKWPDDCPLSTD